MRKSVLFVFLITSIVAVAQKDSVKIRYEITDDSLQAVIATYEMPTVKILGEKPRLMSDVPGSASFINPQKVNSLQALSGNEVFRTVPGIHVVDEEGVGMRANIGIRGLDPDRSSKVLVLEDGIPVALNPFGEPQLYYTPTIDRMESVEILKGSGQILFGPQTIGGVINYITAAPPKESKASIKLRGGQGGFFSGLLGYGNTIGNTGFQINYLRKQADQIGTSNFRINDLTGKINFKISSKSKIGLKLGFYHEISNSTYVGLTQPMYDKGGQDFVIIAPDDKLDVRRVSTSFTHEYKWNLNIKLKTTAFAYSTVRNWQRQDFSYSPTTNLTGVIWGDTTISNGAIYMRNQNGHRNRQFEVAGIEPRITARYNIGSFSNKLDGGVRLMYERAFEQRVNGTKADAASGTLKNDEIRTGKSMSVYAQNKFEINQSFSITGGLRAELYNYERNVIRTNEIDTSIVSNDFTTQLIPGIGVDYSINDKIVFFGGIHRGFAPPRVKDAIANNGVVYNLEPELSWNSELGFRSVFDDILKLEFTAFYMNFSNQIIPISESSGGSGTGVINGGSTIHSGLELGFELQLGKFFLPQSYTLNLSGNATYIKAYYNEDRFKDVNGESINIKNNRTPYSPEFLFSSSLFFKTPFGLSANFTGTYVGNQFTDELNTVKPSNNGRVGKIDPYYLLDAGIQYNVEKIETTFSVSVKNMTDNRYISTRRPQGIRVGIPTYLSFGIDKQF
jgi:Fe(3+) dicitrate transport protein